MGFVAQLHHFAVGSRLRLLRVVERILLFWWAHRELLLLILSLERGGYDCWILAQLWGDQLAV